MGRSLALYGEYSEAEVVLFQQVLHPGDFVVEAGANIGALTVPIARIVGAGGTVIALEPQRAVYNVLCGNLALNGLLNVTPLRAAAGRAAGRSVVPLVDYGWRGNFGGIALESGGERPGEAISVVAIDELRLERLQFLKADVEGAEAEVLEGAAETIRRLRPNLFVENDRREKSQALITLIDGMGYAMWWHFAPLYNPDNFHGDPNNVFAAIRSINMVCLPREKHHDVKGLRPVSDPDDPWH